jgi:hypothetical protein
MDCSGIFGSAESFEVEILKSKTIGTSNTIGTPSLDGGIGCWCRIFKVDDIPVLSSWIYAGFSSSQNGCTDIWCKGLAENYLDILFSAIQSNL